jgi:glyoxylase-like metal-dependent hydrolase (beta-lactamase superfamily II)
MTDELRFQLGSLDLLRLTEIVFPPYEATMLLPDWADELIAPHQDELIPDAMTPDGAGLMVNVNLWVVRTPHHLMVIDTGIGDGRTRRIPQFDGLHTGLLDRMRAAGIAPEAIDYVLCTHIHSDHVGWNTHWNDERWTPAFPNARYLWSRTENDKAASEGFRTGPAAGVYEDSVLPVIEAGLLDLVPDDGGEVIEGVTFHPTPGHTPGHMSISVRSAGHEAFFSGDVLHSPVQVLRPTWNSMFCQDAETARRSRRWALEHAAERSALVLPAHFGGRSAGRVVRRGECFHWTFA